MALSSSFQARLQEMEDNRRVLLERLQVEKSVLESKRSQLNKEQEILNKVKQRCLLLNQKEADLSLKILEKERELRTSKKVLAGLKLKRSNLQSQLDELEYKKQKNSDFYKEKRELMEKNRRRMHESYRKFKDDLEKLKRSVQQLESHAKELEAGEFTSFVDTEISKEETKKNDMLAQIEVLEMQIQGNNKAKIDMEQKINDILKQIEEKTVTLGKQKQSILDLQIENQSLENQVLKGMQLRDPKKRFSLEKLSHV